MKKPTPPKAPAKKAAPKERPQNKNLKPYSKGKSGNPKGRPKGALGVAATIRKYVESQSAIVNPLTGKKQKMVLMDQMVLGMIAKAIKGDPYAFDMLCNRLEGKVADRVKVGGDADNDAPIKMEVSQGEVDYAKIPDDALKAIVAARKPKTNQ